MWLCVVAFVCSVMCTHPLDGWFSRSRNASGKRSVVFKYDEAFGDLPVSVPCGRCMECRLAKKREWALRCQHEASLYDENCFLTLTYSDEYLPEYGSLRKSDLSGFLKRLRSREADYARKCGRSERKFKFFGCGEYGGDSGRPHYHLLLFGYDFNDAVHFSERGEFKIRTSKLLEDTWSRGLCEIGEVSYDGCAYVAKYVTKRDPKVEEIMKNSGVWEPEFLLMSRGGRNGKGIGYDWWKKYGDELLTHDSVILKGRECRVPRYYDGLNESTEPEKVKEIKARRKARCNYDESRSSRLEAREKVLEAGVNFHRR